MVGAVVSLRRDMLLIAFTPLFPFVAFPEASVKLLNEPKADDLNGPMFGPEFTVLSPPICLLPITVFSESGM